ncbi:hypothetical protein KIPB_000553, partial [Kipferlia bialata]|eukprot:g553.t1
MSSILRINVAVLGGLEAGKTTLLNTFVSDGVR